VDESLVVRPAYIDEVRREDLEALADRLREDGLQARVGEAAEMRRQFPPIPLVETVCIWFAQGAVEAAGGYAAVSAIKWAREQFRKNRDEGECVRVIEFVHDEGKDDEGRVVHALELSGADAEPVALSPEDLDDFHDREDFEEFTRTKR
jgi:hypothetical protein